MWRIVKVKHLYQAVDRLGNPLSDLLTFKQVVDYCMAKRDRWAVNSLTFLLAISGNRIDIQKYKE